jgi:hypothetical protein
MASEGSSLPIRYLAAFEADAAQLVFRTSAFAEPFLVEYARYLRLDLEAVAPRTAEGPVTERSPPWQAVKRVRPPGKGGRTPGMGSRQERASRDAGVPRFPLVAVLVVCALVAVVGLAARELSGALDRGTGARGAALDRTAAAKVRLPELPGGGRRLFPGHLVVALYGSPLTHRLGRLGLGPPSFAAEALRDQAHGYEGTRPVLPALHLVSTVASRHPGPDGSYTHRLSETIIDVYLAEARRIHGLLIIDVQSGRESFEDEVMRYERFLREPDVGLAIDPEWRVGPGQVPGRRVGSVKASEVNAVVDYLAAIVRQYDLPQKLLVIHQFTPFMVKDRAAVHAPAEVAVTFDIDGVGGREAKSATYEDLAEGPTGTFHGIKLYYTKDDGLMPSWEVLALEPQPDLVIYQ